MSPSSAAPLAFSYLRFSSPAQADGDSVRRQTALRDAWLKRHPEVRLDTALTLADRGVSGFTGRHREKGALGQFLDQVERGRVPAGSVLLIENFDRLSREKPVVGVNLLSGLLVAGIKVVQLSPDEIELTEDSDLFSLFRGQMSQARGHDESKTKSVRCGSAWTEKKADARSNGTPHGAMCPAWLELVGGKYRVKANAARTVRKIFEWCAAGHGVFAVLDRLNREKVPPLGRSGKWDRSYVRKILTNPAVIGVYQPMKGHRTRKPEGDPVPGYYPTVIDESLWYAAQSAMKGRARKSGRPATTAVNPFSGLLVDATGGGKLHVCGSRGHKYLVPTAAVQKQTGAKWKTFPLDPLVSGVLSQLRELAAADLFADPGGAKVAELTGRLGDVDVRLARARERFEADPESPTWADLVTKYDRERRALGKELAEARQAAAHPLSGTWAEAVTLMAQDDPARLRTALIATIDSVLCVFGAVGRTRLAAVQVWFKTADGSPPTARRNYIIIHRPPVAGAAGTRPGGSHVVSIKHPGSLPFSNWDLREEHLTVSEDGRSGIDGWRDVESFLNAYPRDVLDRVLAADEPRGA